MVVVLLGKNIKGCYVLLARVGKHPLLNICLKQKTSTDGSLKTRWGLTIKCYVVCVLLVCGLFQNMPNKPYMLSVLMVAADSNAADCVTLLLNHNASVTEVDDKGYNALCRAILNEKK